MLNVAFKPILIWPGKPTPRHERKPSRFRASYQKTLTDLEHELSKVKADVVVIQLDIQPHEIRNDGWPRSTARPSSPRVILSFNKGKQTISMPCDRFDTWEQNLRAISLTLHGLRMIDQYGVSQHDEQYKGFAQIEAPIQKNKRKYAIDFISSWSGLSSEAVVENVDAAYKLAAAQLHPDKNGSHDLFVQLQDHYRLLKGS